MPILDTSKKGAVGEYIKKELNENTKIFISSNIFTIYAFEELKRVLENVKEFNFLFNKPAFLKVLPPEAKEVKEFELNMREVEKNTSEFKLEIGLKNNLEQNQIASKLFRFIKEKGNIKSVLSNNVDEHFILINNHEDSKLLLGNSFEFSLEGLGYKKSNKFGAIHIDVDEHTLQYYKDMWNSIWNNDDITCDVKEEFVNHLNNLYKENSPELVYYLTLFNLFNDKLVNMDDIAKIKKNTGIEKTQVWNSLYNFQHDAVVGAIKKLELYNGCIIADSVGLGKTFEALAIIKYYELRNSRVLVLCPKKLRANWSGFKQNSITNILSEDRFNYDILNHTDLSREQGKSGDIDLANLYWGNYDLVVIDESHAFRNNPARNDRVTRYDKLMNEIIKSGIKTKVLMLSATPVNNGLSDLKNQIMFITEDNDLAFKENLGIDSISNTLKNAQTAFNAWGNELNNSTDALLSKLDYSFFNLLDTVTIARSRKHIQKYYDTKDIGEFPTRLEPISKKTDIDTRGNFPTLKEINTKITSLNLAIYSPLSYLLPTRVDEYEEKYSTSVKGGKLKFSQYDRERSLIQLMRINLLKRMESSINSFKITVEKIFNKTSSLLSMLDANNFDIDNNFDEDDELFDDIEIGGKVKVKLNDLDKIRYKTALIEDLEKLNFLLSKSNIVTYQNDAKLQELEKMIIQKVNNPINENNRKIIIFTAFSDTAVYLYDNLQHRLMNEYNLNSAIITGSSDVKSNVKEVKNNFESILVNFSPKSNRYNIKNKEIDILFATDCISEGQNLQDCDYLINYDIHWNPVRIIQRFGRIDRIGSNNKVIQLVNFWPNMELDEYINLESRVRSRMTILDIAATGDDDLLSTNSKDLNYRKEQLEQLKDSVLDVEDLQGGISITDLTLDDFIMSLDRFKNENPNVLEKYPTGVHAITNIPSNIKDDASKGVIFCLKQRKTTNEKETNSLFPYHLIYVKNNGDILISNSNPKKILDLYKALCSGKDEAINTLTKAFNDETNNASDMSIYTNLLDKAVLDIKGIVEKKGRDSLFNLGDVGFANSKISGIDDFELISFLVVK